MFSCQSNQTVSSPNINHTANLTSLNIFTICLHGLVSTIGIVENLLILCVVGFKVRRSVISIWILNLAASDLLTTMFLPFFTLYMARGNTWTLGTTFCRVYSSIFFFSMFFSGYLLAVVSMDRCLVVLKPVWAQNYRNIELAKLICVVIWVLALICTIPFYLFRDTIPLADGRILCYYNYALFPPSGLNDLPSLCEQRKQSLAFTKLLLAFLIPLIAIIFSYVAVNARFTRRGRRCSYRFVRLVVAVVVSFVLCWAPYHLFIVMEVMAPTGHPVQVFVAKALPVSVTIAFFNCVLNPVLYVFSCPDLCSKIRHSLRAVMENVLVEDLADLAWRRSSSHSTGKIYEIALRQNNSLVTSSNQEMGDEHG